MTTMTTTVPATTADIVRHCQTLPNGYMILECRRFVSNVYDLEQNMTVASFEHRTIGPLVKELGTRYFYYPTKTVEEKKNAKDGRNKYTMEIVHLTKLPANYVVTNSATVPPVVLKVGDILVCAPPTTATSVSSASPQASPPPQQGRWKIATLQSVVEARDEAIKEGRSSYLIYFAQAPPAPNHHHAATTRTNFMTATYGPKTPSMASPPPAVASLATGATTDRDGPMTTTTTALRVDNSNNIRNKIPTTALRVSNNNISNIIPIGVSHEKTVAPTVQMKNDLQTTTNGNPKLAVAVATMPSPDDVPSATETVPSSSAHLVTAATWATTKRKATVGQGNGKNKLKSKKRHYDEKDNNSVASVTPAATTAAGTIRTADELSTNVFDKMPQKKRQHTLHQKALAIYDAAKKLVDVTCNRHGNEVGQAALHAALCNYVPPPVPALVTPPTTIAATGDIADMFQQVGDFTVVLIERNKEFERYIAAMDQWKVRLAGAVQEWNTRAEARRQDGQARTTAHVVLDGLQHAVALATAALRRAEEKEAESAQAEMSAHEALLACLAATAVTE
jgi:hypothetical protein